MMTKEQRTRQGVFWAVTIGYGLFYVCRLSINVLKKSIVDDGFLTESELGIIGSALFFAYAIGKFVNGFLADRVNVRYFMSAALLVCAIVNAVLALKIPFIFFVILWALNGWFQSAGSPCCIISLKRWFGNKGFGTMYGFWSASHNIGEAITFVVTAFVVTGEGRLDRQTVMGKAPSGVLQAASSQGIPTVAIGGAVAWCEELAESGFAALLPIVAGPTSLEVAMQRDVATENVRRTAVQIAKMLSIKTK